MTPPVLLEPSHSLGDQVFERLDAIQAFLEREARAEATRERVDRPAARGAPGIQAGPAAEGPAADLRRPDPAPRRHRQDDRGPADRG